MQKTDVTHKALLQSTPHEQLPPTGQSACTTIC